MRRVAGQEWKKILFTDEKLFTIEAAHNHQNDRIWSKNSSGSSAIIGHSQHLQSVMVCAGICASEKTPLIFVEPGVKLNADVYQRDILEAVVLSWSQQHFESNKTFQHRSRTTQHWISTHFPGFITPQEWPLYSPDLNTIKCLVDFGGQSMFKTHRNLEALRRSLLEEWDKISDEEVCVIAKNFTKRLMPCMKAKGRHFATT